MSVLLRTHHSVQERKGRIETSVPHSADITQFCLRKSSNGSHLTLNVNSRDFCITRTHISVKERKGGSESSVLHCADITQFCLRKSRSGSGVTVTVNYRDICITPDTYLCASQEGREWVRSTQLCRYNTVLFEKFKFWITGNRNCYLQRCVYYRGHISLCKRGREEVSHVYSTLQT
jgi:hypothetical protein